MRRIRLKKKPSFFEDLSFSHWLQNDRLLAVVLDRHNRVEEVRMDAKHHRWLTSELKSRNYL